MNDLLLRALKGEAVERPPVWMMRQAGRTLPEYRAVRAEAGGFKDLLMHPDRAAEVTLQPIDAYGVDAAILFSDILVVPEAMGLPYNLVEKVGPRFPETIRSRADLDRLREVDPGTDLKYVLDAIRVILDHLDGRVPLIGFSGAPWTIFCYMVEGKGSKDWTLARRMLWEDPQLSDALLSAITQATKAYLHAQIDAGVHVVQIFDSWAGSLSRELYVQRILPHMHDLLEGLNVQGACHGVRQGWKPLFERPVHLAVHHVGFGLANRPPVGEGTGRCRTGRPQGVARQPRPKCPVCKSWHHSCRDPSHDR